MAVVGTSDEVRLVAERKGRRVDLVVKSRVVRDGHVISEDWERICRRRGKFWGMEMSGGGMWVGGRGGLICWREDGDDGAYRKLPLPIE